MKLGVMTVLLGDLSLDETLKYLKSLGVQEVEIGCGGTPGTAHADAIKFMEHPELIEQFQETVDKYGIGVAALSCHGNPVHPNKEVANAYHEQFEAAICLAEKLGVKTVVGFSGCPGDCDNSQYPNWVVATWPDDFQKIKEWQWNEKLIPYWKKEAEFCKSHGVRVAFEMHPGFLVYNPETLLRIREEVGDTIGANFDPSHLFWQGIDPVAAIRYLGKAIYYFHAKDTKVDEINTARIGVLDNKPYGDEINRAWVFRSVGYGHAHQVWKDMMSALRMVGYDGCVSIEHEDSLMSATEGLQKAIAMLKDVMMFEGLGQMWWA